MELDYEQVRERERFAERINPCPRIERGPDWYYNLRGTCKGCRRVTWLCRRDRRCRKYATTIQKGYEARPTGYQKANAQFRGGGTPYPELPVRKEVCQ